MSSSEPSTVVAQQSLALQSRRTLYVGGLEGNVKEMTLRAAFISFGPLKSVDIPMDYTSGTHKGFGFVEFEDPEDAAEAIYNMDGGEIMGRTLTVNLAQPNSQHGLNNSNKAVWSTDEWFQDKAVKEQEDANKAKASQTEKDALADK
jgi:peptidyl-prolyl isomerase E (cyclophilin E)